MLFRSAYVMLQAALWDLEGVSSREDSQLTKRLKGWAAALALPLRQLQAEELLNRACRRANEDVEQGGARWSENSFRVLRRGLNAELRARLGTDLTAIVRVDGAATEEQQRFLARVAAELPAPDA